MRVRPGALWMFWDGGPEFHATCLLRWYPHQCQASESPAHRRSGSMCSPLRSDPRAAAICFPPGARVPRGRWCLSCLPQAAVSGNGYPGRCARGWSAWLVCCLSRNKQRWDIGVLRLTLHCAHALPVPTYRAPSPRLPR